MLKLVILLLAFMSLQSCGNLLIDDEVEGSSNQSSSAEVSGLKSSHNKISSVFSGSSEGEVNFISSANVVSSSSKIEERILPLPKGYFLKDGLGYFFAGDSVFEAGISKLNGSLKNKDYRLLAKFISNKEGMFNWKHPSSSIEWDNSIDTSYNASYFENDDFLIFEGEKYNQVKPSDFVIDSTFFIKGKLNADLDLEPLFFGRDTNFKCSRKGDTTWIEFKGFRGISFYLRILETGEIRGLMTIVDGDYQENLLYSHGNLLDSSNLDGGLCEFSADYFIFKGVETSSITDFHIKIPFSQSTG